MSGSAGAASGSGWTGWAVTGMSSFTSKIYNKATTKSPGKPQVPAQPLSEDKQATRQPAADASRISAAAGSKSLPHTEIDDSKTEEDDEEVGDGWEEDNWGELDESSDKAEDHQEQASTGWDVDDDWGSLEDSGSTKAPSKSGQADHRTSANPKHEEFVSTKNLGLSTTDSYDWGGNGVADNFFSSMGGPSKNRSKSSTPVRETAPPTAKSSNATQPAKSSGNKTDSEEQNEEAKRGWDDGGGWGGDSWDDAGDFGSTESKADKMKKDREEKKKQRQKEMQEKREAKKTGGAMKLGVKKVTDLSDLT